MAEGRRWPERIWRIQIRDLLNPGQFHTDREEQAHGWEETGADVRPYILEAALEAEREKRDKAFLDALDAAGLVNAEEVEADLGEIVTVLIGELAQARKEAREALGRELLPEVRMLRNAAESIGMQHPGFAGSLREFADHISALDSIDTEEGERR